jgi:hypothetical protein
MYIYIDFFGFSLQHRNSASRKDTLRFVYQNWCHFEAIMEDELKYNKKYSPIIKRRLQKYYALSFNYHYLLLLDMPETVTANTFISDVHNTFFAISKNPKAFGHTFKNIKIIENGIEKPIPNKFDHNIYREMKGYGFEIFAYFESQVIYETVEYLELSCSSFGNKEMELDQALKKVVEIFKSISQNEKCDFNYDLYKMLHHMYMLAINNVEELQESINSSQGINLSTNPKSQRRKLKINTLAKFDWIKKPEHLPIVIKTLYDNNYITPYNNQDIANAFIVKEPLIHIPIMNNIPPKPFVWKHRNQLLLFMLYDYLNQQRCIEDFQFHQICNHFLDKYERPYNPESMNTSLARRKKRYDDDLDQNSDENTLESILSLILS